MMFFLILIIWLIIGFGGYVYFWTKEYDITLKDFPQCISISLLGVIGFIIMWATMSDIDWDEYVIFRKRK